MRLFVAVFPPPEIREQALKKICALVPSSSVRWSKPQNVHLTLKFLGNAPEEARSGIENVLEEIRKRHAPFEIELTAPGGFPSARRAKVIWAGVGAGHEELRALAEDVDGSLAIAGFETESRPYTPHLTLGRASDRPVPLPASSAMANMSLRFRIERLDLVLSTLTNRGARYEILSSHQLGPAA